MRHLAEVAERTNCAIVLVGHMNKRSSSKGIYRGLGSIDFAAAARSILLVGRVREDPNIRVMAHIKSSLAPEGTSVAFELDSDYGFRWIGEYDATAEDILSGADGSKKQGKLDAAIALLRSLEPEREIYSEEIVELSNSLQIGKRTLYTAKKELSVRSVKKSGKWYWIVPQQQAENTILKSTARN